MKKIPKRKCVGCGENKPQKELIRIVKNKEKGILIDQTNKINGRGVYICKSADCLKKARENKEIEKNLRNKINEEIYNELEEIIG